MKDPTHTAAPAESGAALITVQLAGTPREVAVGTTLAALMQALGHAPLAMSTAVNGDFVLRGQRDRHVLQAGDMVLFFQPIVGG